MKRILFLSILIFTLYLQSSAQRRFPDELVSRIQGKTKLVDIMREVNNYYDFGRQNVEREPGEDEFESNDYHWWKKWEYWARRRLNPDGTLADYKGMNYLARKDVEARFGEQLRKAEAAHKNSPPIDDRNTSRQAAHQNIMGIESS